MTGHKSLSPAKSCKYGRHSWGKGKTATAYGSRLMDPHMGPWYICRKCGFATSPLLQPEGWVPDKRKRMPRVMNRDVSGRFLRWSDRVQPDTGSVELAGDEGTEGGGPPPERHPGSDG